MSANAVSLKMNQAVRFYRASIGKKVVMAVTGLVVFGYVFAHLIGNLQIFLGREQINLYAEFLHSKPALLWIARLVLLTAVGLHVVTSIQLWLLKRKARPVGYVKEDDPPAGYASRTMLWSGPIIAAFVVFHILHLTTGSAGLPYRELDVYDNVVNGFRIVPVSIAYIVAVALLCLHLYHGVWSMFQSLGISHPLYTPLLKKFAAAFSIFIAVGNISIPVAVMAGLVGS
jgi:succinate dehydrogenase / fumarate reductase cytochrome b subunit